MFRSDHDSELQKVVSENAFVHTSCYVCLKKMNGNKSITFV